MFIIIKSEIFFYYFLASPRSVIKTSSIYGKNYIVFFCLDPAA